MRGRPNIHKTAEVSGVQPCVWAGGRSAALLPVNRPLSSLAFRYLMFTLVYALRSTLSRTLLLYSHLPHPLFLALLLLYGSLLHLPYQRNMITQIPLVNRVELRIMGFNPQQVRCGEYVWYGITSEAKENVNEVNA